VVCTGLNPDTGRFTYWTTNVAGSNASSLTLNLETGLYQGKGGDVPIEKDGKLYAIAKIGADMSCKIGLYDQNKQDLRNADRKAGTCRESSLFLQVTENGNSQIKVLTSGGRQLKSLSTSGQTNEVDPSYSTNGDWFTGISQDGMTWNLFRGHFNDMKNVELMATGALKNPSISNTGTVAFERIENDGQTDVQIMGNGFAHLLRDVSNAFWVSDNVLGYISHGVVFYYLLSQKTTLRMSPVDLKVEQPVVAKDYPRIMAFVANSHVVLYDTSSKSVMWASEVGASQPALNANGTKLVFVRNGQIYGYEPEKDKLTEITQSGEIANPMFLCENVVFEVDGVIRIISFTSGMRPVALQNVAILATTANPKTMPSFSAHTMTRPELQRGDWFVDQVKGMFLFQGTSKKANDLAATLKANAKKR
jgi:hypothetical protein